MLNTEHNEQSKDVPSAPHQSYKTNKSTTLNISPNTVKTKVCVMLIISVTKPLKAVTKHWHERV